MRPFPFQLFLALALAAALTTAVAQTPEPQSSPEAATTENIQVAAEDFSQVPTRDLENLAVTLTNRREYAQAVPVLRELIERLKDSEQPAIQARLEGFRFFLGVGLMTAGEWEAAVEAFEDYQNNHKAATRNAEMVREFLPDCLAAAGRYREAAEKYQELLNETPTGPRSLAIMEKLVNMLIASRDWQNAVPVLNRLLIASRDERQRELLATALARAYIETDQSQKILEILPGLLSRAPRARLSVEFNLALLAGGDRMRAAGQPLLALLFYQLILPTDKLREWNERLRQENEALLERVRGTPQLNLIFEAQRMQKVLETEKALLDAAPDFTEDLRMRIAQVYFELNRLYEAMWSFWNIFLDFPEGKFSQQACYATYSLAAKLQQDDKAQEAGLYYLTAFPEGEYWDEVSAGLARLMLRNKLFSLASNFIAQVLETKPEHPEAADLLYLRGFALFQQEEFQEAHDLFARVVQEFPDSSVAGAALYWQGMCLLFQENYAQAEALFERYLKQHPQGEFAEDAAFRQAVCVYAREDFDRTAELLAAFVQKYPSGPISGEAFNLLGDCHGAKGRLDQAESSYRSALEVATRQAQIDHATFQLAQIYEVTNRPQEMLDLIEDYLERYGTEGNYTQAVHRKGFALRALGREEDAVNAYWQAVMDFGNDPQAMGVDLILDEYLNLKKQAGLEQLQKTAEALRRNEEKRAMFLRLLAALHGKAEVRPPKLTMEDLDIASPAVLAWIGKVAEDPEVADAALRRVTEDYGSTQWAVDAWMQLGEKRAAAGEYEAAEQAFLSARELIPTHPRAAVATLRVGDMRRARNQPEEAIKSYEEILQVREWRGAIWPQALYQIGETYRSMGKDQEAYAFFQRIYVLYRQHREWVAKAYLQCAEISLALGLKGDALRTLAEMLQQEDLSGLPEFAKGRELFEKIQ